MKNYTVKSYITALVGFFLLSTFAVQAQDQDRPKSGPEQKKMEIWVGEWMYEGASQETPLGAEIKFAGKQTCKMVLGGFFLETRWEDKSNLGDVGQGVSLQWYDPATKTYRDQAFENDGTVSSGSSTVSGNTWFGTSSRTDSKGKIYKTKFSSILSADGKTSIQTAELSGDDGKSWMPWWQITFKKTIK